MEPIGINEWLGRCVRRLQEQWRSVDPEELEQVALDLLRSPRLRVLPPEVAAVEWLKLGVLIQSVEPG